MKDKKIELVLQKDGKMRIKTDEKVMERERRKERRAK